MGWSIGFDSDWNRDIGYGVPAVCDHPGCNAAIDRGLAYVCGNEARGGEHGCGLYFCDEHKSGEHHLCDHCAKDDGLTFTPKPDTIEWMCHKLFDDSWKKWRDEHPAEVANLKTAVAGGERFGKTISALILGEIAAERKRQDEQWGGPAHDDKHGPMDWWNFIGDQCEKVGRAVITRGVPYLQTPDHRQRIVKVAALCVAFLESLDRREGMNSSNPPSSEG